MAQKLWDAPTYCIYLASAQNTDPKNPASSLAHKHVAHRNVVDGSSMIGFPLVMADSERDMPGIEHGPLGWQLSALTTELQEVRQ